MKKVIFAYVPQTYFHPVSRPVDMETPASLPLGLACVKAYAGADKEITGQAALTGRKFGEKMTGAAVAAALAAQKPDVAAFSCFMLNAPATLEVCRRLKKLLPGAKIVVGGAAVPREPKELAAFLKKNPAVDAAVFGEGEVPFANWLKAFLAGAAPAQLDGLALRGGKGPVIGKKPCTPDLAAIPSPYLSGAAKLVKRTGGSLSLETARGCPFSCAYCAHDAAHKAVRRFPLGRLQKELAWLKKNRYEGTVWIVDPLMNLKRDRAAEVFKMLARDNALFMVNLMPELVDDGLIDLLVKIPRAGIAVGIQSANPAALRNMGRVSNLKLSEANIRKLQLRCKNIEFGLQLILGLPGDNYETFKATMDWTLGLGRSYNASIMDLVLLDNSPLSGMVKTFSIRTNADGLVTANYSFTRADFMKASWLVAVYHAVTRNKAALEKFERACAREGKPSLVLERLAFKAVKTGLLPKKRLVIDSPEPCAAIDPGFLKAELAQ